MKLVSKMFARLNVLGCEEKISRDTKLQDMDKNRNLLWTIDVMEETPNEKYGLMNQNVVRYKSLTPLEVGDNLVEFKMTSMGEGSGSFIKVNNYYTILSKIDAKATVDSLFDPVASIVATTPPKKAEKSKMQ